MDRTKENAQLGRGVEFFNTGKFFEAHEAWEEIWLGAQEPEKTFLQGLIQIAAAFHHWQRANQSGARSLLQAGIAKLENCRSDFRGIDAAKLCREARECLATIETGSHAVPDKRPKIRAVGG